MLHVHVPKTAGTSLCSWAERRGLPVARHKESLCWERGDGPYWMGQAGLPASCRQRLSEARGKNFSWNSVERWVDLPLCEGMRYVVALRRPVERTLHQFKHLLMYFQDLDGYNMKEAKVTRDLFGKLWRYEEFRGVLLEVFGRGARQDPDDWLDDWLGMSTNYQVRTLAGAGGGEAYTEDAELAEQRLGAAAAVLEQMDVVLVVGDDPRSFLQLRQEHLLHRLLDLPILSLSSFPVRKHNVDDILSAADDWEWQPGERRQTWLRNLADARLVAYGRLLEELDGEYFHRFGLGWDRKTSAA